MKARLISLLSVAALFAAAFGLLRSTVACADSWAPPETETTLSANGQYRFTLEPVGIESQMAFFEEEAAAAKAGKTVERPAPLGLLEKRNAAGKWEPVWAIPLLNPMAPVSVLVSDDGRHVVTFDNWHSMGHGEHVVVIYGPEGKLVRSMALTDIVPADFIDALPRSVSSIQWRNREALTNAGTTVTVEMPIPGEDAYAEDAETIAFTINLADGAVTPPNSDEWEVAQCAAAKINAASKKAEAERVAALVKPLTVPTTCELSDWHDYLDEAYLRRSDQPVFEAFTSTTVLFARENPRHRESVGWLRDNMLDEFGIERDEAFASPCDPEGLVVAVAGIMKDVRPGSLSKATFHVSAPKPQFTEIARLIAPSGAKTVWLDPEEAIPQRPDRIPGSPEEKAAIEAWSGSVADEAPVD
ncbi:MAG: hypothetical protein EDM03_08520 [Porphyrobacter sp. IPPAS B-1204]|nr:MAG: hypothetical protein EDM03_08520 [Porphyrobacter sp. IPPAS B-1204]